MRLPPEPILSRQVIITLVDEFKGSTFARLNAPPGTAVRWSQRGGRCPAGMSPTPRRLRGYRGLSRISIITYSA
jgi:hypothetical protein